jgi:predicted MFS family arabinose efflux permease
VSVLHGGPRTNGLLLSARGVGGVAAAVCIASLGRMRVKGRLVMAGAFAFPLLLLVFASLRSTPLAVLAFGAVGAAWPFILNLSNALVQTLTPDGLRGRVMGIYTFTFFGAMPVGSLWIGLVAQHAGEPTAIVVAAACSLVVAAGIWVFVPQVRALE